MNVPEDIALISILGLLGCSAPIDFCNILLRAKLRPARYRQGHVVVGKLAAIEDDPDCSRTCWWDYVDDRLW